MRAVLTSGLLVAVALTGCSAESEKGLWGSTPGSTSMDPSGSTAPDLHSSTAPADESTSTPAESKGTSEATVWDMGVPDFGSQQPAGCRGKIDFVFVISADGTMEAQQSKLIAGFPGFMAAIKDQFSNFDFHILVANPNPGWMMQDCSLCKDDCDPHGSLPTCGAKLSSCDKKIGAGVTFPAGTAASNRRCELASGRRYIVSGAQDMTEEFSCIAQMGLGGTDHGGEAMAAAVQAEINDPADEEQCNTGFLRDDALLVVTIIQDGYDEDSSGTVEEWISALRDAKHGDEDAFAVLVLTTDVDDGYGGLCWPELSNQTKNRLRLLAQGVRHGFVGSICEETFVPFFAEHVGHLVELCGDFVPPG